MLALGLLCPFSPFALSLSWPRQDGGAGPASQANLRSGAAAEEPVLFSGRNKEREARLNRQWRRGSPFDGRTRVAKREGRRREGRRREGEGVAVSVENYITRPEFPTSPSFDLNFIYFGFLSFDFISRDFSFF